MPDHTGDVAAIAAGRRPARRPRRGIPIAQELRSRTAVTRTQRTPTTDDQHVGDFAVPLECDVAPGHAVRDLRFLRQHLVRRWFVDAETEADFLVFSHGSSGSGSGRKFNSVPTPTTTTTTTWTAASGRLIMVLAFAVDFTVRWLHGGVGDDTGDIARMACLVAAMVLAMCGLVLVVVALPRPAPCLATPVVSATRRVQSIEWTLSVFVAASLFLRGADRMWSRVDITAGGANDTLFGTRSAFALPLLVLCCPSRAFVPSAMMIAGACIQGAAALLVHGEEPVEWSVRLATAAVFVSEAAASYAVLATWESQRRAQFVTLRLARIGAKRDRFYTALLADAAHRVSDRVSLFDGAAVLEYSAGNSRAMSTANSADGNTTVRSHPGVSAGLSTNAIRRRQPPVFDSTAAVICGRVMVDETAERRSGPTALLQAKEAVVSAFDACAQAHSAQAGGVRTVRLGSLGDFFVAAVLRTDPRGSILPTHHEAHTPHVSELALAAAKIVSEMRRQPHSHARVAFALDAGAVSVAVRHPVRSVDLLGAAAPRSGVDSVETTFAFPDYRELVISGAPMRAAEHLVRFASANQVLLTLNVAQLMPQHYQVVTLTSSELKAPADLRHQRPADARALGEPFVAGAEAAAVARWNSAEPAGRPNSLAAASSQRDLLGGSSFESGPSNSAARLVALADDDESNEAFATLPDASKAFLAEFVDTNVTDVIRLRGGGGGGSETHDDDSLDVHADFAGDVGDDVDSRATTPSGTFDACLAPCLRAPVFELQLHESRFLDRHPSGAARFVPPVSAAAFIALAAGFHLAHDPTVATAAMPGFGLAFAIAGAASMGALMFVPLPGPARSIGAICAGHVLVGVSMCAVSLGVTWHDSPTPGPMSLYQPRLFALASFTCVVVIPANLPSLLQPALSVAIYTGMLWLSEGHVGWLDGFWLALVLAAVAMALTIATIRERARGAFEVEVKTEALSRRLHAARGELRLLLRRALPGPVSDAIQRAVAQRRDTAFGGLGNADPLSVAAATAYAADAEMALDESCLVPHQSSNAGQNNSNAAAPSSAIVLCIDVDDTVGHAAEARARAVIMDHLLLYVVEADGERADRSYQGAPLFVAERGTVVVIVAFLDEALSPSQPINPNDQRMSPTLIATNERIRALFQRVHTICTALGVRYAGGMSHGPLVGQLFQPSAVNRDSPCGQRYDFVGDALTRALRVLPRFKSCARRPSSLGGNGTASVTSRSGLGITPQSAAASVTSLAHGPATENDEYDDDDDDDADDGYDNAGVPRTAVQLNPAGNEMDDERRLREHQLKRSAARQRRRGSTDTSSAFSLASQQRAHLSPPMPAGRAAASGATGSPGSAPLPRHGAQCRPATDDQDIVQLAAHVLVEDAAADPFAKSSALAGGEDHHLEQPQFGGHHHDDDDDSGWSEGAMSNGYRDTHEVRTEH